jgi:type II secretory pathway component PulM
MGLSEQLSDKWTSAVDSFKDSSTYQALNNSYQQLSPEHQTYVRWGGIAASVFLLFYLIFSATQAANSVKDEYYQKQELLTVMNQAGDEIRRLKGQNSSFSGGGAEQNWRGVLANVASGQGLAPDALQIAKESAGSSQTMIQETLIEAELKGVFIRPLVQFIYQIEHNSPPMKLKGLQVEPGAEGQLNARLVLSGFMPKADKK